MTIKLKIAKWLNELFKNLNCFSKAKTIYPIFFFARLSFPKRKFESKGQAMTSLLFVVSIVFFLATQASLLNLSTVTLSSEQLNGALLLTKAEGYLENAALRFLRNPSYSGETLQEGNISCTMQVTDIGGAKDIESFCQKDQRKRKVGLTVTVSGGIYNFSKIEERGD